jgi:hypothetical protein
VGPLLFGGELSFETQLHVRSEGIADHLLAKKLATQEEVDACGIEDDYAADDPETALIVRYGDLRALHAARQGIASHRPQKADRLILDALRGASVSITLTEPLGDMKKLSVHPKSLNALIELAERDAVIGFFNAGIATLRTMLAESPTAERVDLLTRATREVGYQQQLCVWIVTHAGPGLPYPEDETTPVLPEWVALLSPIDVLLVFRTHEDVNAGRLAGLQSLPRGKSSDGDNAERGWGVYLASLASLMNKTAEQLSRDQSLAALFAQSYVHAVEQERAMAQAKGEK